MFYIKIEMPYSLFRDLISLTEKFEEEFSGDEINIHNFSIWLSKRVGTQDTENFDIDWEGRVNGRSAESIINTSLVHLYKYAKLYSKLAIADAPFSTIEEVIFLINLLHSGSMSKKQLIEMNILEKSTGIQIINRLLSAGFITETTDVRDRRSKQIEISTLGESVLAAHMDKIREASKTVVGNLTEREKLQLIQLLSKLEDFHKKNIKDLPL